nr:hypothetical protein [Tanacetum cinerariifolium]
MNYKKHTVDLESFREMLLICLRIPGQAFTELPFEEEILEFIWFLGHGSIDYAFLIWEDFVYQVEHKNQKKSNEMYYPRFTKYGAILPIELTNDEIKNSKAYKEYYACATAEAAPKPKASARSKRSGSDTSITPPTATTTPTTIIAVTPRLTAATKGKQPAKAKSPSDPSDIATIEAQQLKIVLRRSREQTHISQLGGFGIDERTGSKTGVPDVPSDDSEEELSWISSDDEETDAQEKDRDDDEGDERGESDDGEQDDAEDKDGDERDDDDDDKQEIASRQFLWNRASQFFENRSRPVLLEPI